MSFESLIASRQQTLPICTERELFDIIEETGETIWVIDHEIYHGRMTPTPELNSQRKTLQEFIEEAVKETERFGVDYADKNLYWDWYHGMKRKVVGDRKEK